MNNLKYISWNVNGLRACIKKGFLDSFKNLNADCLSSRNKITTSSN